MMNDLELTRHIQRLEIERATVQENAKRVSNGLTDEIRIAREMQNRRSAGLDENKVRLAEHVIEVRGAVERNNEGCLGDAINDLANGTPRLRREYFGVKNYDRFVGQRCDCSYGMGPKHGHIVFEIGLTQEARKRDLTEEEANAAIYYLVHLKAIQEAAKAATAA